jgi:hypothetical protein
MSEDKKENKQVHVFSRLGGMGLPISGNYASTLSTIGARYIPYSGNGLAVPSMNRYPQLLAELAANTPTHGAALQRKGKLTYGQGFDFEKLPKSLVKFLLNVNKFNESANDILYKVGFDLVYFGGISIKVHWNYNKTIHSIEHVPFKYVRIGMPVDGEIVEYVVSNDWQQNMSSELRKEYVIKRFNPDAIGKATVIDDKPVADEITLMNATQLVYYKCYSPSADDYYPVPDYVQGLDSIFTEMNVGVTMNNQISNGINGSYIISTDNDTILDDESKQEIIDMLNAFSAGAENAGGLLFLPANVKVQKLEALPFDIYNSVNGETRQRIITSHLIPAILLEFNFGGGFNNRSQEMKTALEQFQQTIIAGYQQQIVRVFNTILDYVVKEPYDLQIKPFELVYSDTTINVDKNITVKKDEVVDTTAV